MFFKNYKFKYISGVILFVFVFIVGFVKMNIVYSSTGIGGTTEVYSSNDETDTISTINDQAFIRIYKEDYGFDIVFNAFDNEKIFSLRLPWRKNWKFNIKFLYFSML